ncbi:MAG: hypothetical protein ACFFDN_18115 [Candidatus Hodarchaeota archaeon]
MKIDSLFSIIEKRVNFWHKKLIIMDRLKMSLVKIRDSIDVKENTQKNKNNSVPPGPKEVQMVHFQVIEDTIYRDPDLIDDNIKDKFFLIKNPIETGAEEFPLTKEESKKAIQEILDVVEEKRDKLKKKLINKIIKGVAILIIILIIITSLTAMAAKVKSDLFVLFPFLKKNEEINREFCPSPRRGITGGNLQV